MSDTFSLGGEPGSIRASGQAWKSFASSASSASSDIKSVDAASFQGDEGDTYRSKVNDDLPPRLDKTHEAWNQVGTALITYASTLEDLQKRLAALKTQHDSAVSTANAKENSLESAKSADKTHDQQQTEAKAKLKPGETLPPSPYQSSTSSAQSQLNEANSAVQDTINKANTVHSEHKTALNACCNEIEDAKGKRFEKPPGFWGKLKDSVVDWVKDHADVLTKISGVLKIISAIAGVLSFIPILAPIMLPISLAAGGAALLIDVGVKLATGKGSWLSIGIDAATMLLPGVGKLVGKGLKMTTSGTKVLVGMDKGVMALKNRGSLVIGKNLAGLKAALKSKVPVTVRVPGLATAGGPNMNMVTKNLPGVLSPKNAGAAFREGRAGHIPTIKINSAKYPETASHVRDAQKGRNWAGDRVNPNNTTRQPDVVEINRGGAAKNRRDSTGQYPTKTGSDRDEYPPAMFKDGGEGASVKYINPSDNRGAGSTMGWDIRSAGYGDGQSVRIVVE